MDDRKAVITETIFPISFYVRAGEEGGMEVVAVSRKGERWIFRLNDLQSIHLSADSTLQLAKRAIAQHSKGIG